MLEVPITTLMFQFLIGRLTSADSAASYEEKFAFQFLIGRLTSPNQRIERYGERIVSIPHR